MVCGRGYVLEVDLGYQGGVCPGCFGSGPPHLILLLLLKFCYIFWVYFLEEDFEGLLRVVGSHRGADGLADHVELNKFTFFRPVGVAVEPIVDVFPAGAPEMVDIFCGNDGNGGELWVEDGFGGAEGEEVLFDLYVGVGYDNVFVFVQDAHLFFRNWL